MKGGSKAISTSCGELERWGILMVLGEFGVLAGCPLKEDRFLGDFRVIVYREGDINQISLGTSNQARIQPCQPDPIFPGPKMSGYWGNFKKEAAKGGVI